jgi:hypothetical protein
MKGDQNTFVRKQMHFQGFQNDFGEYEQDDQQYMFNQGQMFRNQVGRGGTNGRAFDGGFEQYDDRMQSSRGQPRHFPPN